MKTERELNSDILKITSTITEKFPELSKFISEMPVPIADMLGSEISVGNLEDYYKSLQSLMENYSVYHKSAKLIAHTATYPAQKYIQWEPRNT